MITYYDKSVLNSVTDGSGQSIDSKAETYGVLDATTSKSGNVWIKNFLDAPKDNIIQVTYRAYSAEKKAFAAIDATTLATALCAAYADLADGDIVRLRMRVKPDGFIAVPFAMEDTRFYDLLNNEFVFSTDATKLAQNIKNAFKRLESFNDVRMPKVTLDGTKVYFALKSGIAFEYIKIETVEKDFQTLTKKLVDVVEPVEAVEKAEDITIDTETGISFSAHEEEFGGFKQLSQVVFPTASNTMWGADQIDTKPIPGGKYSEYIFTVEHFVKEFGYDAVGENVQGQYNKILWVLDSINDDFKSDIKAIVGDDKFVDHDDLEHYESSNAGDGGQGGQGGQGTNP